MNDIKTSKSPWKLCETDRRAVVDSNDLVVADLRNWKETDDGAVLTQVPQMLEVVLALSGTDGVWADEWLNTLARKATDIELIIRATMKGIR